MGVPSLVDICTRKCIKHVTMIHDLGDLPYKLAKPILRKVENPDQLHAIELNSPQLEDDTPEYWRKLIAKHFPDYEKKNYMPKNPRSWYRVYAKYKKENDEALEAAAAKLKNAFSAIKNEKDKQQSGILKQQQLKALPKLPKDGRGLGGGRGVRDLPDHLTWGGGSRTKLTNGQSFLKKARREAHEVALRRQLSTPTGKLKVPEGQIKKAPEAMVQQYRVQQQADIRIHAPRKRKSEAQRAEEAERREREARLLKIKQKNAPAGGAHVQMVSDSEYEDDDDEANDKPYRGLEDIFGDDISDDDLFDSADSPEQEGCTLYKDSELYKKKRPPKAAAPSSHLSDNSSTTPKRSGLLSNSSKSAGGLRSNTTFSSGAHRPVTQSPAKSSPQPPQNSSPPPKPRPFQSSPPAQSPALKAQPAQSPPLRPQLTPAGSPVIRKRKPDVFMRQVKRPKM
jgi:elongin-A